MPRVSYDMWASERERAELLPNGLRVIRDEQKGRPIARAWKPRAKKPLFNYTFRSVEERDAYIARVSRTHDEQYAHRAEHRAAYAEGDLSLTDPGAIFCSSWGYEQTNVEYFQVVARRGQFVTLRAIRSESVSGSEGAMSDAVRPVKDGFIPPSCETCGGSEEAVWHEDWRGTFEHRFVAAPPRTFRKRVQFNKGEPFIRFDHSIGSLVKIIDLGNGVEVTFERHYRSWYA